jgi:membrane-associated protease RseP (regulator of RpoE activity)
MPINEHYSPIVPDNGGKLWLGPFTGRRRRSFPAIHLILFISTTFTTVVAGAVQAGVNPLHNPAGLLQGIPFAFTLLFILLTHELGHYSVARLHHMEVSLPYLIPAPSFIGTFGAFIKMRSAVRDKRSLMDIGAAGPLAGVLVAIPVLVIGLKMSTVKLIPQDVEGLGGIRLGSSLLFDIITRLTVGTLPDGHDLVLHPVAFAGWIGLLVTALNLLPVGQLDGGHVLYAVMGEHSLIISRGVVGVLVLLGIFGWSGWLFWALLLIVLGSRHPFPIDSWTPLDRRRKIIGLFTFAVFLLTFTPVPFRGI